MLAIADAVAARFATVATPSGETIGLVGATARNQNNVPGTPYIVVEMPESDEITVANQRVAVHDFDVYFLLDKASGDIPRDKVRLYRWLPGLLDATYGAMKLGLATVRKSYVTEYEYGTYNYGGTEYHSWHLVCRVWTEDAITLVP
jgi:hypothetical protein